MHRPGPAAEVASPVPSRSTGRTMEVGGVAPEEPRPRSRRQPLRLRGAYKRFLYFLLGFQPASESSRRRRRRRRSSTSTKIWIQPEHPKHLTATFCNLTFVGLLSIFPECDLSWTLFILEAAPALQNFSLSRGRHLCVKMAEDSAEETNVVWEPSKDLKHLNLKLLQMSGFEEEEKVTSYIRLVMERAVGLKRIELRGEVPCKECDAIDPRRSQVDEARRHRIKEWLTHGSSSSVEIIMR